MAVANGEKWMNLRKSVGEAQIGLGDRLGKAGAGVTKEVSSLLLMVART